jgi:hypothetical protein
MRTRHYLRVRACGNHNYHCTWITEREVSFFCRQEPCPQNTIPEKGESNAHPQSCFSKNTVHFLITYYKKLRTVLVGENIKRF